MNTYLAINYNGKEAHLPIALSESQLRQLCRIIDSEDDFSGWEAPEEGSVYYYADKFKKVQSIEYTEENKEQVEKLYNSANCFGSEVIAADVARSDLLFRQLRRFAVTHRTKPVDFAKNGGYTIVYNYQNRCLEIGMTGRAMAVGDVIFESEKDAREAINEFNKELIWYFTEMRYHL